MHDIEEQNDQYIQQHDLNALEVGKSDISEGLKSIISDAPGKTAEVSTSKFECHNKNINIQLSAKDLMGQSFNLSELFP